MAVSLCIRDNNSRTDELSRADAYKSCLSRAKRAITTNSFPTESMAQIEEDITRTLPALHLFHKETGPMYGDLKDLLCAWLVARSDEGLSYVRYTPLSFVPYGWK